MAAGMAYSLHTHIEQSAKEVDWVNAIQLNN